MQKIKVTQNLVNKKMGLKVDGKRVLKNEYNNINTTYANSKKPVVLLESYYENSVYDLEKQKIVATNKDTLRVYYHTIDKTKLDSNELLVGHHTEVAGFKYNERKHDKSYIYKKSYKSIKEHIKDYVKDIQGQTTNLFLNNKMYEAPQDYKRIEYLKKNGAINHIFVAIKKDNTAEIINSNNFGEKTVPLDIHNLNEQNPYIFTVASSDRSSSSFNIELPELSKVKESISYYFYFLEKKATCKKELKDIKEERINCLNKINKNFKEQAQNCEKRASEFKQASIESKNYLESLEQQKKQTNKMLYCETRKAENKLHYNERGLEYLLAFNKLSEDFNNYVQNVKNDYTKDPQNKKSSQYNSQEMAI